MSLSPRKKRAKMERRAARTVSWTFHQQNTLSKVEGKSKTPISDAVPALFSSFVLWRKSGLMRYAWMSGVVRTIWWRPVTSGKHFAQKRQNWDPGFTCRSTGASSLCLKKPSALRKKGWKNLMTEIHRCAKCGLSLFDNCNARFFNFYHVLSFSCQKKGCQVFQCFKHFQSECCETAKHLRLCLYILRRFTVSSGFDMDACFARKVKLANFSLKGKTKKCEFVPHTNDDATMPQVELLRHWLPRLICWLRERDTNRIHMKSYEINMKSIWNPCNHIDNIDILIYHFIWEFQTLMPMCILSRHVDLELKGFWIYR